MGGVTLFHFKLRNESLQLVFDLHTSTWAEVRHPYKADGVSPPRSPTFQPEEMKPSLAFIHRSRVAQPYSCCHLHFVICVLVLHFSVNLNNSWLPSKETGWQYNRYSVPQHFTSAQSYGMHTYTHTDDACCTVKASQSLQCVTSVIVLIRQCHRLSPVTFIAHLNILPRQMVRMSRRDTELLSPSPLPLRQNAGLVSTRLF